MSAFTRSPAIPPSAAILSLLMDELLVNFAVLIAPVDSQYVTEVVNEPPVTGRQDCAPHCAIWSLNPAAGSGRPLMVAAASAGRVKGMPVMMPSFTHPSIFPISAATAVFLRVSEIDFDASSHFTSPGSGLA